MGRIKIIAELAWGHDGKLEQAVEIMKRAKNSGADLFSIHITDMPNYMVPYYGSGEGKVSEGRESLAVYEYLKSINLSNEEWSFFAGEARKTNMPLCIMPNDINSLIFAEKNLSPEFYVLSAACFIEEDFIQNMASLGRKTLFRIGGATLGEIERAINVFRTCGNDEIILLHGFQNYPTNLEETNISQLKILSDLFNVEVGLADHIDGGSDLAKIIPVLAVAYGAKYIEKHITLDRGMKSEDFESALDPEGFSNFVSYIHSAEIAIGDSSFKQLSEKTIQYRNVSRKRMVAKYSIAKGEIITRDNIAFKRSDVGLTPEWAKYLFGRISKEDLNENDAITLEKLI